MSPFSSNGEPSSKVVVRCAPNRIHEFYSLCIPKKRSLINVFFPASLYAEKRICRATWWNILLHIHQNEGVFVFNNTIIWMDWRHDHNFRIESCPSCPQTNLCLRVYAHPCTLALPLNMDAGKIAKKAQNQFHVVYLLLYRELWDSFAF